jgi:hypothetical protein
MEDSVSVLDWGMSRLEERLQAAMDASGLTTSIGLRYDWEGNRIWLEATLGSGRTNIANARVQCSEWIHIARSWLGVDPRTGAPALSGQDSLLVTFFSHSGFQRTTRPERLGQELDALVMIAGNAVAETTDGFMPIRCEGRLLGQETVFASD